MIFIYSLIFTALVSFFAVMIIPDAARQQLLGQPDRRPGHVPGRARSPLRLLFHGFVVLVGTLILAGAVNTAIVGSNGVLNRVAEDGVLPDWFRHPHRHFGTTHRIHQPGRGPADRSPSSSAAETFTCWAKPMPSA